VRDGVCVDTTMGFTPMEGLLMATRAGDVDTAAVLARDDDAAHLAVGVYVHRLRAAVAAMGGIDALVFTGGVGEHAPGIRARAADGLAFLGVELDPGANARARADADIGASGAAVRAVVVTARADLEVVRQVRALLVG
jgi:acetate kinase